VSCTSTSASTPGVKGSETGDSNGVDLGDTSPTPVLRLEGALAELAAGNLGAGREGVGAVNDVITYMQPGPDFLSTVGKFGLPLTISVVNDNPLYNMRILRHDVWEGSEYSYSMESRTLAPGAVAKWEAYAYWGSTVGVSVEVALDDPKNTHYQVHAVKYRMGNWFSGCDDMIGVATEGGSFNNRPTLCHSDDHVYNGHGNAMAFFLPH